MVERSAEEKLSAWLEETIWFSQNHRAKNILFLVQGLVQYTEQIEYSFGINLIIWCYTQNTENLSTLQLEDDDAWLLADRWSVVTALGWPQEWSAKANAITLGLCAVYEERIGAMT